MPASQKKKPEVETTIQPQQFKGQKSTLDECNAYLKEIGEEEEWIDKGNTKLLCYLRKNEGLVGNLCFYRGTRTLLIQGRDAGNIRTRFAEWRGDRLKKMELEVLEKSVNDGAGRFDRCSSVKSSSAKSSSIKSSSVTRSSAEDSASDDVVGPPALKRRRIQECPCLNAYHPTIDGQKVCVFSGEFECKKCFRFFFMTACRDMAGNFQETMFPACWECKENIDVTLLDFKPLKTARERRTTTRGHQRDLCQFCSRGLPCGRA